MEQSLQVLEWMAEGEARGVIKGAVRTLLRLLELKFTTVPADVAQRIKATTDPALLDSWFDAAIAARTIKKFRQVIGF